jgi:hypothetical protein
MQKKILKMNQILNIIFYLNYHFYMYLYKKSLINVFELLYMFKIIINNFIFNLITIIKERKFETMD